jgi:hypothetical protein
MLGGTSMKKTPNEGGCWFCNDDEQPLLFDVEFDTFVHEACLRKHKTDCKEEYCECRVMMYLLEANDG